MKFANGANVSQYDSHDERIREVELSLATVESKQEALATKLELHHQSISEKIDNAMDKLSIKIDHLVKTTDKMSVISDKSEARIEALEDKELVREQYVGIFKKIGIPLGLAIGGGALTKLGEWIFEVLK